MEMTIVRTALLERRGWKLTFCGVSKENEVRKQKAKRYFPFKDGTDEGERVWWSQGEAGLSGKCLVVEHENFEHVCGTGKVANREEEILNQGRTEKRL